MKVQLRAVLRDIAIILPALAVALGACDVGSNSDLLAPDSGGQAQYVGIPCKASVVLRTVQCEATGTLEYVSADFVGQQNVQVKLTSSNVVGTDSTRRIFSFDVTVKNLMPDSIGTPDGTGPPTTLGPRPSAQ